MTTKLCKAKTISGKKCKFPTSIGDYCMCHWKKYKYGNSGTGRKGGESETDVELCPVCKTYMKLKKSKRCRKCALSKNRRGQVSRLKSVQSRNNE